MAQILNGICKPCISNRVILSSLLQFRFRKIPKRKPTWLPTAPSKVFLIPKHPYVAPEEKELVLQLVEEYFRKIESIRRLFQAELSKKSEESILALEAVNAEELEHEKLMEENRKENERIRKIREETVEKEFQENSIRLLEKYEEKLDKEQKKREKIDQVILEVEEKSKNYVTYDNLDEVVELALDNPINIGFCIDTKGNISWESTPPKEYEDYVQNCLKSSVPGSYHRIKRERYS